MLSTQVVAQIPSRRKKTSKHVSNDDTLSNLQIDRTFVMSTREYVATSLDNEQRATPSISDDKLHRRNPNTVRQEIQSFDDLVLETTLADVQLSEMPGLQNTEQWKRIAARTGQSSPPLSRHFYQPGATIFEQIPQVLGTYRRPGRSENEPDTSIATPSIWRPSHRRILFGLLICIIIIAIIIAVVVAVILVRKPGQTTTDYYSGYILVRARFDPLLLVASSTLSKNYQREFCSLISTTLSAAKTKYAIFYSDCTVNNFRNGSVVGNFILGFTRYQNVTRLNGFLNRVLIREQLFGGTILSIVFSSTTNNNTNSTGEDMYYDDSEPKSMMIDEDGISSSVNNQDEQQSQTIHTTIGKALSETDNYSYLFSVSSSLTTDQSNTESNSDAIKRIQRHLLTSTETDYSVGRSLYKNNSSISSTAVLSRLSSRELWWKFFKNKTTLFAQK